MSDRLSPIEFISRRLVDVVEHIGDFSAEGSDCLFCLAGVVADFRLVDVQVDFDLIAEWIVRCRHAEPIPAISQGSDADHQKYEC